MFRISIFATLVILISSLPVQAQEVVFATDFDDLSLGLTENPPVPGQDGWTAIFHPGNSFGEIQDVVANGGNAIHQFTDITNTNGQQSIDSRFYDPVNVSSAVEIIFDIDFNAQSSDLTTQNSYAASAGIFGDGQLFSFSIGSGNGPVREDVGVSVGLSTFNGTDNNIPLGISVGQNLAWEEWHSVQLTANLQTLEWVSISVNGASQSLSGIDLPRNFNAGGPFTPTFFDEVSLQVVNIENFGDETSDSIFFDNLSLAVTSVPEPSSFAVIGLLGIAASLSRRRKFKPATHAERAE